LINSTLSPSFFLTKPYPHPKITTAAPKIAFKTRDSRPFSSYEAARRALETALEALIGSPDPGSVRLDWEKRQKRRKNRPETAENGAKNRPKSAENGAKNRPKSAEIDAKTSKSSGKITPESEIGIAT
jgi:hypothetical protein